MAVTTIKNEGAFDSTLRTQVNNNYAACVQTGTAASVSSLAVSGNSVLTGTSVLTGLTTYGPVKSTLTVISADGAVDQHTSANYVVTKAGVAAMTLAAPTVTTDDGLIIVVVSNTSNAHTLTATGLLGTGSAAVNVATFAANLGAGLKLMAYQGKWLVLASVGITFS